MTLRTSTVAGLCIMLGALMLFLPLPIFDVEYDGIDNDRMSWSCDMPIVGLNPPAVDLDDIRARLADLPEGEKLASQHPDCRKLAIAQLALGGLALAAGAWQTSKWWREGADDRAEKKFKKLQEQTTGKPKGMMG